MPHTQDRAAALPEPLPTDQLEVIPEQYSFPCTVVQKTCWYFDRTKPGHPSNNIAVRFMLEGPLRVDALERSLSKIVERHEVLRTRFALHGGEPRQIVESEARFPFQIHDLSPLPEAERNAEADRISVEDARSGFDVETGPLFRGQLLRLAPERHMLLLNLHHLVGDGWSVGIITDELGELYDAEIEGRDARLPDLTIQYADYSVWQSEWISGSELASQLDHLKQRLDGFPPLALRTDFPRPPEPTNQGEIRSMVLPRSLTDRVKQLAEREGCTFFMAMYAAFLALLKCETGQSDIVLRTPAAGRGTVELEPLIGWFVNPLAVRTRIPGEATFRDLLALSQQSILDAFGHQDAPFEKLMEIVKPQAGSHRQPPFPVNFILQRDFVKPWKRSGLSMYPIPSKSVGVFADLNFFLVEREDGWRTSVDISTELFRVSTGEGMLQAFRAILEAVAEDPAIAIDTLSLPTLRPKTAVENPIREAEAEYVAPRTEVENEIASIWQKVFGEERVGVNDNFFDLGGHSILATKLTAELHEKYGENLEVRHLFNEPTVAGMARAVENRGSAAAGQGEWAEGIISIQPQGERKPFFLIDGNHWFRPFSNYVGNDQPILGVPLRQFGGITVEEQRRPVAARVARLLLERYPTEDFALGGWCDAGLTAYAVAQEIVALGGRVSLLVLFDTMNPDYWSSSESVLNSTQNLFSSLGSRLSALPKTGVLQTFGQAAKDIGGGLSRAAKRAPDLLHPRTNPALPFPVVLMRPLTRGNSHPTLGWDPTRCAALRVVDIEGDHGTIFSHPHVASIGQRFRDELNLRFGTN